MNPLALLLTSLLWGQAADSPAQTPASPRYGNVPATSGQNPAEQELPSLPRQRPSTTPQIPGQPGGNALPSRRKGSQIPPVSSAVVGESGNSDRDYEAEDSTIPAITLPGRAPGDNVGANPFPAPSTGNPLRGTSSNELSAQELQPNATAVGEVPVQQPRTTGEEAAEDQPRHFVPATQPGSTFVPAVVDDRVVPAAAVGDVAMVPVQPRENEPTAERLLREAFTTPEIHSLSGEPVTLDELLRSQESVGERHVSLVQIYWQLCTAVSQYHWALQEQQILEQAIAGRQIPRVTSADILALRAKTAEAKAVAVDAQLRLAALRPAVSSEELPLPVDRPVVASYRTYFESIFAARTQSELGARHAKRLHETLPLRREAVKAYAESVAAAEELAQPNSNLTQQGQLDLIGLAASLEQLHKQRKAFMATVQTYNQSIADYALLAATPGSSASELLPMLIKVKPRTPNTVAETFTTPQPALSAEIQVGATQVITPEGNVIVSGPVTAVPTTSEASIQPGVIQAGAELPLSRSAVPEVIPGQKQMRSVLVRSGKRP